MAVPWALLGVLSTTALAHASYVKQIDVWYYNTTGSWTVSAANPPGSTVNITRSANQPRVDILIAKQSGAPSSVEYFYADFSNGRTGQHTSTASNYTFQDAVGSQATSVWAGINDNSDHVTINISNAQTAQPDLSVSNVTVEGTVTPQTYQEGQTVDIAAIVWNNGGATAGSSHLAYYIGTSSSSTSDRISTDSVGSLTPTHGQAESTSFTFRAQDVGTRYFVLVADYQNEVAEGNEGNNKASFGPFQVTAAPDPCQDQTPTAPSLVGPASSASGTNYQLTWTEPDCTTDYVLVESTSSNFGSPNLIPLPAGTQAHTFNHTVQANTTYYYRIAANNDLGGASPWSNVVQVNVVDPCTTDAPATPTLVTPADAASGATYAASWNGVLCATRYLLQESTTAGFSSATNFVVTSPLTSRNLSHTVSTPTSFYYRLSAQNESSGRASGWSPTRTTVVSPQSGCTAVTPPAPVSVSPPSSAVSGLPYDVTWTGSGPCATSYVIEEADNPSFIGSSSSTTSGTAKGFAHVVTGQSPFFYRVAARNGGLQSAWNHASWHTDVVAASQPPIRYIALGDSYSSGEGNPGYVERTDDPESNLCHRSLSNAYSAHLSVAPLNFDFDPIVDLLACSGAKTFNVLPVSAGGRRQTLEDGRDYDEPTQLDQGKVDSATEMVTLTIGGNDLGFAPILGACFFGVTVPGGLACDAVLAYATASVPSAKTAVKQVLTEIIATTSRDTTAIFLLGYPQIFPSLPQPNCLEIAYVPYMPAFRALTNLFNNTLADAAQEVGVHFVDVRGELAGHEVCTADPWNTGLILSDVGGEEFVVDDKASFHPNPAGHQAYARALSSFIAAKCSASECVLPSGLPRNPDPVQATRQSARAEVQPSITDLSIASVPTPPCEMPVPAFRPGDSIRVEANGFAAATSATVHLSTSRDGDVGDIGSINVNGDGLAVGNVTIPQIISLPASALIVAVGSGSNGAERTAIGNVGVVASFTADGDVDGIPDVCDLCPAVGDVSQIDYDGDGVGDACDSCPVDPANDADHDGLCAPLDVCPLDSANDSDGDGYCANQDNCPTIANPDQADVDADGSGDACYLFGDGFEAGAAGAWSDCVGCAATGTYHFRYVDSENDVAWVPVSYSGGSVGFAYDFIFSSATYSGGLEAGLFDSSQDGSHTAMLIAGVDGGGRHFTLSVSGMGDARQTYDFQEGVWYRAVFSYSSGTAHLTVDEIGGANVADLWLSGGQPLATLSRFGIGKVDGDGNGQGIGEVDNLEVNDGGSILLETDFASDPGFSTTDPSDFYWNPSGS